MRFWTSRLSTWRVTSSSVGGLRVLAEREAGAGGVEYADGLVRKLAASDVAVREPDGGGDGLIEDAEVVVLFERFDDAAKHGAADLFAGLFDLDDLEAAGEGGVLFEVFFVLGPGGGGDGAEFAASEGWLEEVGGVVLAGRPACTDHGVGFVDEEDDLLGR